MFLGIESQTRAAGRSAQGGQDWPVRNDKEAVDDALLDPTWSFEIRPVFSLRDMKVEAAPGFIGLSERKYGVLKTPTCWSCIGIVWSGLGNRYGVHQVLFFISFISLLERLRDLVGIWSTIPMHNFSPAPSSPNELGTWLSVYNDWNPRRGNMILQVDYHVNMRINIFSN